MNLRKTAVVILGLLILLSGCSSDTAADTASQKEEGANIHAGENHGRETIDDLAADENPAEDDVTENVRDDSNESPIEDDTSAGDIEGAGEDAGSGIIELIPMKQLPDLTMDPQTPFTIDDIINWGTCVLTPVYHETFRYQIREFTNHPAKLVIDIGNTGDEPLVITDENMWYSILDYEGNEIADSKLRGLLSQSHLGRSRGWFLLPKTLMRALFS